MVGANTFTLFPLLPKELRLQIWDLIDLQHNRNVHVRLAKPRRSHPGDAVRTKDQVPVILHTCSESRIEGLKKYRAVLREEGNAHPVVYVNFDTDTLYVVLSHRETRRLINWIVVNVNSPRLGCRYWPENKSTTCLAQGLRLAAGIMYIFDKPESETYLVVKRDDSIESQEELRIMRDLVRAGKIGVHSWCRKMVNFGVGWEKHLQGIVPLAWDSVDGQDGQDDGRL